MASVSTDFATTRRRLGADRARLKHWLREHQQCGGGWLVFESRYQCVWLYRWGHWLHGLGHTSLARMVYHLNLIITGADIPPGSAIDGGLLVTAPMALTVCGKVGENLTIGALSGLGGELGSNQDRGAGPGLPVVGDGATIGSRAGVLGAVVLGNNVTIAPGCMVRSDIPDDTVVEPSAPRVRLKVASQKTA